MSTIPQQANQGANAKRGRGFTLVELLVVIAIIGVLSAILLPAISKSRARAQGMFCLNNTRQLAVAWIMYADDHDGRLAYNLGLGSTPPAMAGIGAGSGMSANWVNNVVDWSAQNPDNTNASKLVETGLGPYMSRAASGYRCPSDNVLSPEQRQAGWNSRVRSYSMNAMIGDAGTFSATGDNQNNPDYQQFFKISAIPRSSDIFVFLDEHPDSIRDGYFLVRAEQHEWTDLPASYHNGAGSFSFADGHSELHRWRNKSTRVPAEPFAAHLPLQITGGLSDFYWVVSAMSVEKRSESEHY